MKVIIPCWGRYPVWYDIRLHVRYAIVSWSNLCLVSCRMGGGGSSDNGYKAHHNRMPLNSICRIGNKPCLVYLGSHTGSHNSHTEIASAITPRTRTRKTLRNLLPRVPRVIAIFISIMKFLLTRERENRVEWKSLVVSSRMIDR